MANQIEEMRAELRALQAKLANIEAMVERIPAAVLKAMAESPALREAVHETVDPIIRPLFGEGDEWKLG
jgi:cell division septum initiation protein DivIVA